MISVILTFAGNGTRFGSDKLSKKILGKEVFLRTIEIFTKVPEIDEIIAVVRKDLLKSYQQVVDKCGYKVKFVVGGSERIISAYNGVIQAKGEIVLIHDGARCLTKPNKVQELIRATIESGAAILAETPTTTIKQTNDQQVIEQSFLRSKTWLAQTPQGFKKEVITKLFEQAINDENFIPSDDSELLTQAGIEVRVVAGDPTNMKITYPHDLLVVEKLLENELV